MNNSNKLNRDLTDRVLEARITKLEAALIKKIREFEYGNITLVVHKIEGQPIRVEITRTSQSCVLEARDGLNLEDTVYVNDSITNPI